MGYREVLAQCSDPRAAVYSKRLDELTVAMDRVTALLQEFNKRAGAGEDPSALTAALLPQVTDAIEVMQAATAAAESVYAEKQ